MASEGFKCYESALGGDGVLWHDGGLPAEFVMSAASAAETVATVAVVADAAGGGREAGTGVRLEGKLDSPRGYNSRRNGGGGGAGSKMTAVATAIAAAAVVLAAFAGFSRGAWR